MSSLGPTLWELLQNFFSWLAKLFYEKERKPDCEEQIGLPTRVVHSKKMSLNATSMTSKNRQGIQGQPARHSELAWQTVFRHPSSKRKAVYDVRSPWKRCPTPGLPLVQFGSAPQRLFRGTHATPAIRIEDWSIFPPSRKSLSHRLSFITTPTRALRLSSFIPGTRQDLLAVPATDSFGHLCFSSLSNPCRPKHSDQKGSEQKGVFISKSALPSGRCGRISNERRPLDAIKPKAEDNKPCDTHSARQLFTRKLHVTCRKTMPSSKRILKRNHFYSLPPAVFSSLLCTDRQAEQDIRAFNKLERVGQESGIIAEDCIAPVVPNVSIDSTSPGKIHEKAGSPTTAVAVTHNPQPFFGLAALPKLPYADFGDVPYPFVFDFDFYLSEADVLATPLLLVSFPGLGSECSSPATDYFDTPTPSPKLPVAPLLMQHTNLSDTTDITCETSDSSRTGGEIVPERSIQESLDTSGRTLSLHSSGIEDISLSQSEYSIPSTDDVNDSLTSSDVGKQTGDDIDRPSTVIKAVSSGGGGACLSEKAILDLYSPSNEEGAGMMEKTLASLTYASCSPSDKSCETGSEGDNESVAHSRTEDSLTIDDLTFCNRHRRLLENLSLAVSNKNQLWSSKTDGADRSTLAEPSNGALVVTYPTIPAVSSNNTAYSQSPRHPDDVSIATGSHLHAASRERSVTGQEDMHDRTTGPFTPLTPMLIPRVGAGVGKKTMRLGIQGTQRNF